MSSASQSQKDSRDEFQLRSTQWLNQSKSVYSLYLRELNEVLNQFPKAPQIQSYKQNTQKYLKNQEYLNRVLNHLSGIASREIPNKKIEEFKNTLETMNKSLEETEAMIIQENSKNQSEEIVLFLILRLIAKQIETYTYLTAEYDKIAPENVEPSQQSHKIDPAQIKTVSTQFDLNQLQSIKNKMIARSKKLNSAELQDIHRRKVAQRDELKKSIENLIGSEVDFQDTIKLYQQRSKAVEEIDRKQQEMIKIQKEIRQLSVKVQTILSKTKMIELTEQSKDKQRQRGPLQILKDIDTDEIPQKIRKSNLVKKIKLTTKKEPTKQAMLWFWFACLVVLFYFYC